MNKIKISSIDGTITGYYYENGITEINNGSYFRKHESNSLSSLSKNIRHLLLYKGFIKNDILIENYKFDSPDIAISVMLGKNIDGLTFLYTIDNIPLLNYLNNKNRSLIEKDDENGYISSDDVCCLSNVNINYLPEKVPEIINKEKNEYKRNNIKAKNALLISSFKCNIDENHKTFLNKNDIPYMEAHHLIPLSKQKNFDVSLDVEANIVCLCPNCHRQLHYGKNVDDLIKKLYEDRKEKLKESGINITLDELLKLYK